MPIATNPETGETVYLADDGQWRSATLAVNPETKETLAFDGKAWTAVPKPKQADIGQGTAAALGAAQGITANFGDEIVGARAAAGLSKEQSARLGLTPFVGPMIEPAIGAARLGYEYLTGGNEATGRYEAARDKFRGVVKSAEEQYPKTFIAGQVGGAVALPVGGMLNAATLPARMGRGAAVGAGVGAAAGVGEGEGLADSAARGAVGAGMGGVIGGAAVPVVEGVIQGGRALAAPLVNTIRGLRNPEDEAARRIATAYQRDVRAGDAGLSQAEFAAERAAGNPVAVVDQGGSVTRSLARSAANTSPEARGALERLTSDRFEGQSGRITDWLRQAFHYPNAHAQQEAIEQTARTTNRAAYARAYRDGDVPVWSPELERLTSSPDVVAAMREAATRGKSRAVTDGFGGFNPGVTVDNGGIVTFQRGASGQPTYPNLQFWDYTKRALDDAANAARRSGRNEEAATLGNLAGALRGELDNLVPSYGQARAGAAQFFGAENALEAGQNFVGASQRFGIPEARRALAEMSPQERQLFQDGYVSRYIETLNATGDRRNLLNKIGQSGAAREELNVALGTQRAAQLEVRLRVEQIMDRMRGALGNSTTARQLAEAGLAGGATGVYTGDWHAGAGAAGLVFALRSGGKMLNQRIDQNVARRVGELLASNDPNLIQRGVSMIASNPRLMRVLRAADESVAKIGGTEAAENPGPLRITVNPTDRALQTLQTDEPQPPVAELASEDDATRYIAARRREERR
jgi:hypothetical protein